MKLKVVLTKRSNYDMDYFDFLTETLLREANAEVTAARLHAKNVHNRLLAAEKKLNNAETEKSREEAKLEYDKVYKEYEAAVANLDAVSKASRTDLDPENNGRGGYLLAPGNNGRGGYLPAPRNNGRGGYLPDPRNNGRGSDIVPVKSEVVTNKFIEMMKKFGNNVSDVFKWIMDQLRKLPGLAGGIIDSLKKLWEKIKGWNSKFHIFYRTKALSRATVCCVGFIASMVVSWIYSIIFGKNSARANQARFNADRLRGRMRKHMHLFAHPGMTKTKKNLNTGTTPEAETAVFIETFGEILREDFNGKTFVAMARKFIARVKASGKVKAVAKALNNSPLANFLQTSVNGADAALKNPSDVENINDGTRFDDSLPALYESIIWEAQAHKIKEIKKKAKRKVAIKKARSRKALRGRM